MVQTKAMVLWHVYAVNQKIHQTKYVDPQPERFDHWLGMVAKQLWFIASK